MWLSLGGRFTDLSDHKAISRGERAALEGGFEWRRNSSVPKGGQGGKFPWASNSTTTPAPTCLFEGFCTNSGWILQVLLVQFYGSLMAALSPAPPHLFIGDGDWPLDWQDTTLTVADRSQT